MRYLITFACYGCHLHGDERGSVDVRHNAHATPVLDTRATWVNADAVRMQQEPYQLDEVRRSVVLEAICGVCSHRGWHLLALHVRTNHVHAVVEAEDEPERMLNDFKAYASRALNATEPERQRWARHGSTRWLWDDRSVSAAIRYVVEGQGEAMTLFIATTG